MFVRTRAPRNKRSHNLKQISNRRCSVANFRGFNSEEFELKRPSECHQLLQTSNFTDVTSEATVRSHDTNATGNCGRSTVDNMNEFLKVANNANVKLQSKLYVPPPKCISMVTYSADGLQSWVHDDEKSLCPSDLSLDHSANVSFMLQIHEVKLEAASACDFVTKTFEVLEKTVTATVVLGMFISLPVAMISIGVKYLNECPKEPKIPIYLLVGGCFGLLKFLSMLWKQVRSRRYERLDVQPDDSDSGDVFVSKSSAFTEAILSIFLLTWFFCGNYWVLRLYKPNFQQLLHEPSNWCDKTVYMFAFVQIIVCYVIGGIVLLVVGGLALCYKLSTYR